MPKPSPSPVEDVERAPKPRRAWSRSRWWSPAVCLVFGVVLLAALWIGGDLGAGLGAFAVFAVLAAVFAFGGRSETVRGLGGPGRDERWSMIDLRATAFNGVVVITLLVGLWIEELARGQDGDPYGQILVVSGISYVLAIVFLRWRS